MLASDAPAGVASGSECDDGTDAEELGMGELFEEDTGEPRNWWDYSDPEELRP